MTRCGRAVEDEDEEEEVEEINPQQSGRGGGGAPGGSYIRGLEPLPARGGPGVSTALLTVATEPFIHCCQIPDLATLLSTLAVRLLAGLLCRGCAAISAWHDCYFCGV